MPSRRPPTRALDKDAGDYYGGSSRDNDGGADDSSPDAEIDEYSEMNQSVVIGTKDLIRMLSSPGQDGDVEEYEGDMDTEKGNEEGNEDEERDLVMDLDPRFKSADIKRKFSGALIEESDAREEDSGVQMHVTAGMSGLDRDPADGGNGGDSETNESVVIGAKDLIRMLPSPEQDGDVEEQERGMDAEEGDDDEERDVAMDLDPRFKSADIKRKFSDCSLIGESDARKEHSGVPMHMAAGTHILSGGSASGGNGGDGAMAILSEGTKISTGLKYASEHNSARLTRHIKTVLRVRPLKSCAGDVSLCVKNSSTVMTTNPVASSRRGGGSGSRLYTFDKVMDESTPQQGIFETTAEPLVAGLFESPARSGTLVAYGATNAGKTHTIMGAYDNEGVLPLSLASLYRRMQETRCGEVGKGETPLLRVSLRAAEVYKNKAYDLLRDSAGRHRALSFKQTNAGDEIVGLSDHYPADLPAALDLVKRARTRAPVAATALNATSSRGHTVWMIELQQRSKEKDFSHAAVGVGGSRPAARRGAAQWPMLRIVDLAGSERIKRSLSHTDEAMHINMDTSALFTCFNEVEAGSQHVSWRRRIITRLLKSMLVRSADTGYLGNRLGWRRSGSSGGGEGGGAETAASSMCWSCIMIINVNPAASEYSETEKVLSNALMSSKARPVEERALAGGGESSIYGMDGHLIKRQKSSHQALGAGSSSTWAFDNVKREEGRRGAVRSKAGSSASAAPAATSQDEHTAVIDDQAREIARLESEVSRMQEDLDMMQEVVWNEAQNEIQQELFPLIADLEDQLRQERDAKREQRVLLCRKRPVEAPSRAAATVESARKQAAEQVETVCDQQAENIREAEDEIRREQEQISRTEAALVATAAERDAEAARAAKLAVEQAALREDLNESKAEASRVKEERFKLDEALAAKAACAESLEEENMRVKAELESLREENCSLQEMLNLAMADAEVSTVQMDFSCESGLGDAHPHFSSASAAAGVQSPDMIEEGGDSEDSRKSTGDSGGDGDDDDREVAHQYPAANPPSTSESRGEREVCEALMPRRELCLEDEGDHIGGESAARGSSHGLVSGDAINVVVDDKDFPTCFDGASLMETHEPAKDGDTTASLPQALPYSASGGGSRCEGGPSNTDVDPDQEMKVSKSLPEDPRNAPSELKEPHGRALPSGRPARMTRSKLRQPLGSLQPTRMDLNRGGRGLAARAIPAGDRGRGKGNGKGKAKDPRDVGSDDDDAVVEEEETPRTKRKRERKEKEKVERAKKMKIQEVARSRKETRRCRQDREEAMLSKPKTVAVARSRKQGDIVDKANEIAKARRSGRRRGK